MAIISAVIDGKRHVTNDDWTRCGILIPFGTPWESDPRDGDPAGKLCKTCYATVEAEEEAREEREAEKAEESKPSETLAQAEVQEPAKSDKNKPAAKATKA